jgi:serine/threonine-protein kinase Chk2
VAATQIRQAYGSGTIDLLTEEVIIGRKSSCDVTVSHGAVSGRHCRLFRRDGSILCEDLSTNGTFVGGRKIGKGKQQWVPSGTEIVIINPPNPQEKIGFSLYSDADDADATELGGPGDKYQTLQQIGAGAFATVYKCMEKATGATFAMKKIDKRKYMMHYGTKREETLLDEVRILRALNHPNIIGIVDNYLTQRNLYLVLELVTGGDLFDQITDFLSAVPSITAPGGGYPEDRCRHLFQQMVAAIQYLVRTAATSRVLISRQLSSFLVRRRARCSPTLNSTHVSINQHARATHTACSMQTTSCTAT